MHWEDIAHMCKQQEPTQWTKGTIRSCSYLVACHNSIFHLNTQIPKTKSQIWSRSVTDLASHILRLCRNFYLPKFCLSCLTTGIWIIFWQFAWPCLAISKNNFWPSWSRMVTWANKHLPRQGPYLPKLLFYSYLAKKQFFLIFPQWGHVSCQNNVQIPVAESDLPDCAMILFAQNYDKNA